MSIEELKTRIFSINGNTTLDEYNEIIKKCVAYKEMAAVVYVYDKIQENGLKPSNTTYNLIDKLHSKTIPESKNITITYSDGKSRLQPRRRIHKIMKGHNYGNKYNNAKIHIPKVREFLDKNPNYKSIIDQRIKLAKIISKECKISFNDARFVITSLKRQKYFSSSAGLSKQTKISNFFKINN